MGNERRLTERNVSDCYVRNVEFLSGLLLGVKMEEGLEFQSLGLLYTIKWAIRLRNQKMLVG